MPISPQHVHGLTHREVINTYVVEQVCHYVDDKLMTTTWLLDNIERGSIHGDHIKFQLGTGEGHVSEATCRAIAELYEKAGWPHVMCEFDRHAKAIRLILYAGMGFALMQVPPLIAEAQAANTPPSAEAGSPT